LSRRGSIGSRRCWRRRRARYQQDQKAAVILHDGVAADSLIGSDKHHAVDRRQIKRVNIPPDQHSVTFARSGSRKTSQCYFYRDEDAAGAHRPRAPPRPTFVSEKMTLVAAGPVPFLVSSSAIAPSIHHRSILVVRRRSVPPARSTSPFCARRSRARNRRVPEIAHASCFWLPSFRAWVTKVGLAHFGVLPGLLAEVLRSPSTSSSRRRSEGCAERAAVIVERLNFLFARLA